MNHLVLLSSCIALAFTAGCASPRHQSTSVQPTDLTGTWQGPDGISLSVRQVSQEVWWVARSGDGGRTFTSVFHGKLNGDQLTGEFADVPEGLNRYHGSLDAKLMFRNEKATAIEGEILVPGRKTPLPWSIHLPRAQAPPVPPQAPPVPPLPGAPPPPPALKTDLAATRIVTEFLQNLRSNQSARSLDLFVSPDTQVVGISKGQGREIIWRKTAKEFIDITVQEYHGTETPEATHVQMIDETFAVVVATYQNQYIKVRGVFTLSAEGGRWRIASMVLQSRFLDEP
jgi:hypothetical protein